MELKPHGAKRPVDLDLHVGKLGDAFVVCHVVRPESATDGGAIGGALGAPCAAPGAWDPDLANLPLADVATVVVAVGEGKPLAHFAGLSAARRLDVLAAAPSRVDRAVLLNSEPSADRSLFLALSPWERPLVAAQLDADKRTALLAGLAPAEAADLERHERLLVATAQRLCAGCRRASGGKRARGEWWGGIAASPRTRERLAACEPSLLLAALERFVDACPPAPLAEPATEVEVEAAVMALADVTSCACERLATLAHQAGAALVWVASDTTPQLLPTVVPGADRIVLCDKLLSDFVRDQTVTLTLETPVGHGGKVTASMQRVNCDNDPHNAVGFRADRPLRPSAAALPPPSLDADGQADLSRTPLLHRAVHAQVVCRALVDWFLGLRFGLWTAECLLTPVVCKAKQAAAQLAATRPLTGEWAGLWASLRPHLPAFAACTTAQDLQALRASVRATLDPDALARLLGGVLHKCKDYWARDADLFCWERYADHVKRAGQGSIVSFCAPLPWTDRMQWGRLVTFYGNYDVTRDSVEQRVGAQHPELTPRYVREILRRVVQDGRWELCVHLDPARTAWEHAPRDQLAEYRVVCLDMQQAQIVKVRSMDAKLHSKGRNLLDATHKERADDTHKKCLRKKLVPLVTYVPVQGAWAPGLVRLWDHLCKQVDDAGEIRWALSPDDMRRIRSWSPIYDRMLLSNDPTPHTGRAHHTIDAVAPIRTGVGQLDDEQTLCLQDCATIECVMDVLVDIDGTDAEVREYCGGRDWASVRVHVGLSRQIRYLYALMGSLPDRVDLYAKRI